MNIEFSANVAMGSREDNICFIYVSDLNEIMLGIKRLLRDSEFVFTPETWDDFGFKVFSQSNEDRLIQFSKIRISSKPFIEFGVGDYSECNTKFLLLHN